METQLNAFIIKTIIAPAIQADIVESRNSLNEAKLASQAAKDAIEN